MSSGLLLVILVPLCKDVTYWSDMQGFFEGQVAFKWNSFLFNIWNLKGIEGTYQKCFCHPNYGDAVFDAGLVFPFEEHRQAILKRVHAEIFNL